MGHYDEITVDYLQDNLTPCISKIDYGAFSVNNLAQDLSGTLSGAGGIGGLISVTRSTSSRVETFYPLADANGNICDYVDTNGNVAAHKEFDAYGITITSSGNVNDFNFWFSTKYWDSETGLYQFNHRYYSPPQGRFTSKDPIEEEGGVMLYGFCGNDGVNKWDVLGTKCCNVESFSISKEKFWVDTKTHYLMSNEYGFGYFIQFELRVDKASSGEDCLIQTWREGYVSYYEYGLLGTPCKKIFTFSKTLDRGKVSAYWWDGSDWDGGAGMHSVGAYIKPLKWDKAQSVTFYDTPGKPKVWYSADAGGYPIVMFVDFETTVLRKKTLDTVASLKWHISMMLGNPPKSTDLHTFRQAPFTK